jgi:hypothetical protein
VVSPGTYYLLVSGSSGTPERFGLTITQSAASTAASGAVPDGCGINDTYQCAQPVALGQTIEGEARIHRERYYKLELDEPGLLRFSPNPLPNRQTLNVNFADAQYQRIERRSWRAGQPAEQTIELASPGTYYLVVSGSGGAPEQFGLTVTQASPR